jgi:hypothetical protein
MTNEDIGWIQDNIKAREAAETALEFVTEAAATVNESCRQRYWSQLLSFVCDQVPDELHPKRVVLKQPPYTDGEAKWFGGTTMPFGEHRGKRVDEVPMSYLLWLDKQPDFRIEMKRYLASKRLQVEQEDTDNDGES